MTYSGFVEHSASDNTGFPSRNRQTEADHLTLREVAMRTLIEFLSEAQKCRIEIGRLLAFGSLLFLIFLPKEEMSIGVASAIAFGMLGALMGFSDEEKHIDGNIWS